uniref:Protein kinase domain-containing protein n=1 Tax=Guillardia theta TaxID=55529 RepID=A0A6U5YFD2_GUITH|mmetsp:Transcript_21606/g.71535  ORF Transcript_21606/g.71535 Transcript_21606/m.71535 type:complete len:372 (+) Transcript_21606:79-1194(+)
MEAKPSQKREGMSFDVPERYQVIKRLGEGSFGLVVAAKDAVAGKRVAIKKIKDAVEDEQDGKRLLRELKLLRYCRGHENFIIIKDIILSPPGKDFKDIYIVTDLMDTDLHRIVRSPQPLSDDHVRYFIYQVLRGLKYIHSAHVMHRDLKPNNLLVNANCDLKICDLGLARLSDGDESLMTCYVVTRWYRAPELLLGNKQYTDAIDMWSVGCVLAELLGRKPLFQGKDYVEMLQLIIGLHGNPKKTDLKHISEKAQRFLSDKTLFPASKRVRWADLFPRANTQALDLLDNLLQFNPEKRLTAEQALAHPYMHELHDVDDEPSAPDIFDFSFERQKLSVAQIREIVVQESLLFSNLDNKDLAVPMQSDVTARR